LVLTDGIVSNIRNGLRLAFFLKNKPELLTSSAAAYVSITLFELFFELLQSLALAGFAGHFNVYSFAGAVFHIPLFLLSGFLIARLARRDDLILSLPVIFTAIWIPLGFLASIFYGALEIGWFGKEIPLESASIGSAFFYWWILAVIIATLRMIGVWGRRKLAVYSILLFLLVIPLRYVPRGNVWEKPYDDTEISDRYRIEKEDAFYAQPVLLEQPPRLGRTKGIEDLVSWFCRLWEPMCS
jgi:hypothetical protein